MINYLLKIYHHAPRERLIRLDRAIYIQWQGNVISIPTHALELVEHHDKLLVHRVQKRPPYTVKRKFVVVVLPPFRLGQKPQVHTPRLQGLLNVCLRRFGIGGEAEILDVSPVSSSRSRALVSGPVSGPVASGRIWVVGVRGFCVRGIGVRGFCVLGLEDWEVWEFQFLGLIGYIIIEIPESIFQGLQKNLPGFAGVVPGFARVLPGGGTGKS